ncbi:MAG TPA: thioesterase family protein [Ignavibacteriales bacterium]|nr:thioesterase family protein [Ignavibacteriales bacterium]HOL82005.1 thioesterase family protein [Ignavibacteriales bacterium]HOM64950.1 thioesterase family protein [Ignavibacteriales bacterium]HPD68302.1 thioesterase family protein [Ignavibacteriales bacterium]HPP34142.1 thioesterase family protein [Ignavibacteriales bacterium]
MFGFLKKWFKTGQVETKEESIQQEFTVNTYDIDIAGHVNNIAYLRWVEELRVKLIYRSFTLEKLLEIGYFPIVSETTIRYKRAIKMFSKVTGKMWVDDFKHSIWVLKFEIYANGELSAKGTQKVALMNIHNETMETIDERLIREFEKYKKTRK